MEEYRDISWLINKVDVEAVLGRLGIEIYNVVGEEIWSYCPDHVLFTGREPSHPKWSLNSRTGDTFCFTESRGSNLVYTVSRLLKISTAEAVEWILGDELNQEQLNEQMIFRFNKLKENRRKELIDKNDIKNLISENSMKQSGYVYFMYPPNKKATLITKETVDKFGCVQIEYGRYANRVIIPFKNRKGEIVGFCANDILGEKEWLRLHPTLSQKEYRKVLFPSNLEKENYLFGEDKIDAFREIIITEGAREVMKLNQLGYDSVAVLGTTIHTGQLRVLAELSPSKLIIMFDGDVAGYESSNKAKETLEEYFDNIEVVKLPKGYDPKIMEEKELKKILKKT